MTTIQHKGYTIASGTAPANPERFYVMEGDKINAQDFSYEGYASPGSAKGAVTKFLQARGVDHRDQCTPAQLASKPAKGSPLPATSDKADRASVDVHPLDGPLYNAEGATLLPCDGYKLTHESEASATLAAGNNMLAKAFGVELAPVEVTTSPDASVKTVEEDAEGYHTTVTGRPPSGHIAHDPNGAVPIPASVRIGVFDDYSDPENPNGKPTPAESQPAGYKAPGENWPFTGSVAVASDGRKEVTPAPTQSRNKREGRYAGKIGKYHMRVPASAVLPGLSCPVQTPQLTQPSAANTQPRRG